MDLSAFLAAMQHEVQKSYDYVDEVTHAAAAHGAPTNLRMALQGIDIELPIAVHTRDLHINPKELEGLHDAVKRLRLPFSREAPVQRFAPLPQHAVRGVAIDVRVVGPDTKADDRHHPLGTLRLSFKPIWRDPTP
jgi:hypothetical protein